MIEAENLTKRYGSTVAVDDVSFTAEAGRVTGILGPEGAGKSTTIRLLFGLARPDSGTATFCGRHYRELRRPPAVAGALLDSPTWHPARTVHDHLLWLARAQRLPKRRVSAVTESAGLAEVAGTPAGRLSPRMSRRLGVAAALLGDPAALVLDDPAKGLDPAEARWMQDLMRGLAARGCAILVSGSRVQDLVVAADDLIVLGGGRLLANCPVPEFVVHHADASVMVRTAAPGALAELIGDEGGRIQHFPDGALRVSGLDGRRIAELAARAGLLVHELTPHLPTLEDAVRDLIEDARP